MSQCHQAYNGLTVNQTRHAKSCGYAITWKCSQHHTCITEIVIPPPTVFEVPTCTSAVGKSCSVCNNSIRSRFSDLAYPCEDPLCASVCHLSANCSDFIIPRGSSRGRALSTQIHLCSFPTAGGPPSIQQHTSPAHLIPPSSNSLLN